MKHVLLVRLWRALQRKEKGILYLDTHAGRGRYDLADAAMSESIARTPEWPDGIGRLWSQDRHKMPAEVADYVELVREFDRKSGNLAKSPRFYPGSPWIASRLARPVDRLALCEKHPAETSALRTEMSRLPRVSLHEMDGYIGIRAMLPPAERRALVLIDPPFETQDEFAQIAAALDEALKRFSSGVFAVWYPLTVRARVDEFFAAVGTLKPPPTLVVEIRVAGESSLLKMKGCGLLVINPPWQFADDLLPLAGYLAEVLAREPGGGSRVDWIVRER